MNEHDLDRIFANYRSAIPDPEPAPDFMPQLWCAIEARRTFNRRFSRLSRAFVTAACAMVLLMATLLVFNSPGPSRSASDNDILADSHAADPMSLDIAPGPDRK